jgi:hypothetical protein
MLGLIEGMQESKKKIVCHVLTQIVEAHEVGENEKDNYRLCKLIDMSKAEYT